MLLSDLLTYQDLFSLQDILLRQLSSRASSVHRVANQISVHWHYVPTELITAIITDLKISTWSCSTHLVVTLLWHRKKSETTDRKFTFTIITFVPGSCYTETFIQSHTNREVSMAHVCL